MIVLNRVNLRIQFREQVHGGVRLDAAHARNRGDHVVGQITLATQTTTLGNQIVDALITAERGLNRMLTRRIGAQAHGGEQHQPFDVVFRRFFRARQNHPAGAVATGAVVFRQSTHGDKKYIIGQRSHGNVFVTVVQNFIVNFIHHHNQAVFTRHLNDVEQYFGRVNRAGRIVWVDDHNGFGIRRDFGANVADRRIPAVFLFAQIVHRCTTGQTGRGRPQRIIRGRHEHFIARVEQTLHDKADQFGHAVADDDVVQGHAFDILLLRVVLNRLARGENPFGVGVAARLADVTRQILLHLLGYFEFECGQITDVQFDDALPIGLHLLRPLHDRAADIVTNIVEFMRLDDGTHDN